MRLACLVVAGRQIRHLAESNLLLIRVSWSLLTSVHTNCHTHRHSSLGWPSICIDCVSDRLSSVCHRCRLATDRLTIRLILLSGQHRIIVQHYRVLYKTHDIKVRDR